MGAAGGARMRTGGGALRMRKDGGHRVLRAVGQPALLPPALYHPGPRGSGACVRGLAWPGAPAGRPRARLVLGSQTRRVESGVRPEQEKAGEPRGCEGQGRPAGQHESAAAGAETAQPAHGPGRGDDASPVPRPHQRGEPAGKSRGRPGS